jgi:hypothetical protein
MGTRGTKIREAIAHLASDGCDLTDPSVNARLRTDDATFHIGYLEEDCGFRLSVDEVITVARAMMREVGGGQHAAAGAHEPAGTASQTRHFYN